jgi:ABC-type glycerol-3-phosphate transport system substrate-binding protein
MVHLKKTLVGGVLAVGLLVAACSSSKSTPKTTPTPAASGGASSSAPAAGSGSPSAVASGGASVDPASVKGDITVLTNRTDLVTDGTLKGYGDEFNKIYPNVKVTFQGLTDYEGETKTRMSTSNYGDVLLIPNALARTDYAQFLEPLGDPATLSAKYRFIPNGTVNGVVYGIAQNGNANGAVYNKTVWTAAGVTTWPTTPDQFIADLTAIKTKTKAIPYYTNYKDGWPLTSFQGAVGSPSCDPKANDNLATTAAPWTSGQDMFQIDSLIFNMVNKKLTEPDPTTTNWENSKTLLANGQIATMWLGSWAVSQMQAAATKAGKDPASIGFMPWPNATNGHLCSVIGPDYLQGINIHSANKVAARAWIDWFTDKSTYSQTQGDVPTLKSAPLPPSLAPYQTAGVTFIELTQDNAALVNSIDKKSEVGITAQDYRQKLVDIARGAAGGTLAAYFDSLNKKWGPAQASGGK